jgi:ABC-type polysaccharide/polyol phosphate transport system ATPase subunit
LPAIVPNAPAVAAIGLDKTFLLPREKVHTLKERALHPLRRTTTDELRALRDVSFAVEHGEFFGIVGRNGSGKSTLLKCLAGIYGVDNGEIYVNGRLSTFIELGVGFNMELAARDNATLNAIMLGLTRAQAEERYQRILDFSELHEFEDLKLKNYSSGMLVRLAFSVMIQVDADILLIDEVLAVGDASFQQKCFDEFNRLRDERRTVLFVTHDMPAVQRFCDRALLLERGEVVTLDAAERVAKRYFDLNFNKADTAAEKVSADETPPRRGDGSAEILEGWFENDRGERADGVAQGAPCTLCVRVRFHDDVRDPHFGVTLIDGEHHLVFAASSVWDAQATGQFAPSESVTLRVTFENWLAPGRYYAAASIARRGSGQDVLDYRDQLVSLIVSGTRPGGGLVDLPHELVIERSAGRPSVPAGDVG